MNHFALGDLVCTAEHAPELSLLLDVEKRSCGPMIASHVVGIVVHVQAFEIRYSRTNDPLAERYVLVLFEDKVGWVHERWLEVCD